MSKRCYKQYVLIKHIKRLQSFDFAFTKGDGSQSFYSPNLVTATLFEGLGLSLVGHNYYSELVKGSSSYSFSKQGCVVFTGSWAAHLSRVRKAPMSISRIFYCSSLPSAVVALRSLLILVLSSALLTRPA